MFFSHTSGSLGASVRRGIGHMANAIAHFSFCRSPLPDLSVFIVLLLPCFFAFCSLFFVHSIMGKDKSRQSRAIRRLEAYNKSSRGRSKDRNSGSSGDVCAVHDSSVGSAGRRNKSHGSRSRSSSPAQPPESAKQLLEQQQSERDGA